MKYDFKKAADAILPSLTNSWKQAVSGAAFGFVGTGFGVAGAAAGFVLGGLANAGVEVFQAGLKPKTPDLG